MKILIVVSVVLLSGCYTTYHESKVPYAIPIDTNASSSLSANKKVKIFNEAAKGYGTNQFPHCPINFYDKTIKLWYTSESYYEVRKFHETSLHVLDDMVTGRKFITLLINKNGWAPGSADFTCYTQYPVNNPNQLKEIENKISILASLLATSGVNVPSKYIRPPKAGEGQFSLASLLEERAAQQRIANQKAEEARVQAESLRQQALKDKRKNDIAARLARDANLPDSVKQDKYLISLTDHLKNERYKDALFYFELLETMGSKQPNSFTYFWGESLYKVGRIEESLDKLYQYIREAGKAGKYYTQALKLSNQAEQNLNR